VAKGILDNGIYIFKGAAVLKRSQNKPGYAIEVTAETQLRKHPVNPVWGLTAVF
jgi:hypothetical protein